MILNIKNMWLIIYVYFIFIRMFIFYYVVHNENILKYNKIKKQYLYLYIYCMINQ